MGRYGDQYGECEILHGEHWNLIFNNSENNYTIPAWRTMHLNIGEVRETLVERYLENQRENALVSESTFEELADDCTVGKSMRI